MTVSLKDKWRTLTVMKFAFPGQKKVAIEDEVAKVATPCGKAPPSSAEPPPPPATFGGDRREVDAEPRGKDSRRKESQKERADRGSQKEENH